MEFPLIESLAVKDGVVLNAHWHEERYAKSFQEYYNCKPEKTLLSVLRQLPFKGYHKLRIAYNKTAQEININPYVTKDIITLKVIEANKIDYHLKFTDRSNINALLTLRGKCDDILIVNDGMVSDTSIANLLFLENDKWITPSTPLLKGTQRAKLLSEGMISERIISMTDITTFEAFQIINAMRPFDNEKKLAIENIIF